MKQIAVYTIILGNYDGGNSLLEKFKEDEIDYFFFTNIKTLKVAGYQMIYVDLIDCDKIKTYAFYKNRIPDIIREYKFSIYYDGNVECKNKIKPLLQYVKNHEIAILINPMMMNIYFHYFLFFSKNKNFKEIYNRYISDGYKDLQINVNTKFLIRKHTSELLSFSDLWYEESQNYYADELTVLYCIYKKRIKLYKICNYYSFFKYFNVKLHKLSISNKEKRYFKNLYSLYQYFAFNFLYFLILLFLFIIPLFIYLY